MKFTFNPPAKSSDEAVDRVFEKFKDSELVKSARDNYEEGFLTLSEFKNKVVDIVYNSPGEEIEIG